MKVNRLRPVLTGRLSLCAALLLGLSLLVAACGVTTPTNVPANTPVPPTATAAPPVEATATTAPTGGATGAAIDVVLADFTIEPKTIDAAGGKMTFNITNTGSSRHNFVILSGGKEIAKSETIGKGGKTTLTAEIPVGSYTTICDIIGHKEAGMQGTLTAK
jgi:plastocyanin